MMLQFAKCCFIVAALSAGFAVAQAPKSAPASTGAAPDPRACIAAFSARHSQMMQQYMALSKSGRIDAREGQAFKSMEDRLRASHMAAAKGGISFQECMQLHSQLDQENVAVRAFGIPTAAQCLTAFNAKHSQVMLQYGAVTKARKLEPWEQQTFQGMEGRLRAQQAAAAKGGAITMQECQLMHIQLDQEMAELRMMVAVPPATMAPKAPAQAPAPAPVKR